MLFYECRKYAAGNDREISRQWAEINTAINPERRVTVLNDYPEDEAFLSVFTGGSLTGL